MFTSPEWGAQRFARCNEARMAITHGGVSLTEAVLLYTFKDQ